MRRQFCARGRGRTLRPVSALIASVLMLAVFATGRAADSPALRLTLTDAVSRALSAGAAARIATLETHRAQESLGAARGGYLPQVFVTSEAGWSNRFDDTFTAIGQNGEAKKFGLATIGTNRGWFNLYLSQILFDLRQWKLIEREELAAEAAALQEQRHRDDVVFEVTRRYAALLRMRQQAGVTQERLVNAEWLAEQADARLQAGRLLEVQHSLAALHREAARLDAESASYDIAAAESELWIAVGEGDEPSGPVELVRESLPEVEGTMSPGQVAELVSASPELRLLQLRRRMDAASVDAAKATRLPKLKLVTGYSHYGIKRWDNYDDEFWVGIDLSIPIFDGFQSTHQIRAAEDQARIASIRYDSALQTKRARVRELLKRLDTGRKRLAIARRRAELGSEQQRLAEALAAREQLSRLETEAIDAYFDQLELWASLQRDLGRLSSKILGSGPPPGANPQGS
jgi:outer membrane protein